MVASTASGWSATGRAGQFARAPRPGVRAATRRRKLPMLWLGALALSLSMLVQTRQAASLMAELLENRFARSAIGDGSAISGLVVLGGGEERLKEAGRLARAHPHLKVLVSGAGDRHEVLAALGEGIAPDRLFLEESARSTFENAHFSDRAVERGSGERWLLVTSALHMPRAIGAFRAVAFKVEPWPVYDRPQGAELTGPVGHELLGLAWYWLKGQTRELWPSG